MNKRHEHGDKRDERMKLKKGHQNIYQQCKDIFEREGLARINDRLVILETFLNTEEHVTAADLSAILAQQGKTLAEKFVAENLNLFAQYGFARVKDFTDQVRRYEHLHVGKHHDHLVCVRCGNVLEFFNPEIETLQKKAAHRMGFCGLKHRMDIYGLCNKCQHSREEVMPLTMATPGEQVRIAGFQGGRGMERRLRSMGLHQGAIVEVIKSIGPGPLIVISGETRIALGFGMAKRILVTPRISDMT